MFNAMDLLSCWHAVPVHKGYRSVEDQLDLSWNDDEVAQSLQKSKTLPLSRPVVSHPHSQSPLFYVNDTTTATEEEAALLDFNDDTRLSIDTDEQLQRIHLFLCSEKSYLDDLRRIFYSYSEPLRKFSSLTSDEMRILFSDLEPLVNLSHDLCFQLRGAIDRWDPEAPRLENLFTEEFWCLYEVYVVYRYHDIQRLLSDKRNCNPEFAEFCYLREIAGDHSIDVLLELPVKRMAFYADQLIDIISDLNEDNPDRADLSQSANFANRIVKLRRSAENEGYITLIQERFPNDDLHLMDRDVAHGGNIKRWKSASRAVQNLGGSRKQSYSNQAALFSNNNNTLQDGNSSLPPSAERMYMMQSPVRLTTGLHVQQRYLFLFNDLLIIAKLRSGSNYRLKHRICVCDLWVTTNPDVIATTTTIFSTETSFVIGWPTTNAIVTFESSHAKGVWLNKLKEQITIEKMKVIPQSIRIKIVMRDFNYTAIKSLLVANDNTASYVVRRCLDEFHITKAAADADYQLIVLSVEDETSCPLIGHEYPYSIWMCHLRDCGIAPTDNISAADVKIQFVLHDKRKTLQKAASMDSNKTSWKGRTLKKLFARPQKQESLKLFGRDLSDLCDQDAVVLPQPIMQMLRKLYVDGPASSGVFRKSGNYAKCLSAKQSLDNGDAAVDIDAIPVFMTAVLLKDFLRSLPNCLLNCQLYSKWMETVLVSDETQRVSTIQRLIQTLPPCNLLLLRYLMCVLHHLASHFDQTKMDSHNLAVCIGQSLLWSQGATGNVVKEDAENVNLLIQQMIDSMVEIFGPDSVNLCDGLPAPGSAPLSRRDRSMDSTEDSICDSLEHDFNRSSGELDSSPVVDGLNAASSNNNNNSTSSDYGLTINNPLSYNEEEVDDNRSFTNGRRSLASKGEASTAPRAVFRSKKRPAPSVLMAPSVEPSESSLSESVSLNDRLGKSAAFVNQVSDDSVLGSLDERSEESSDAELLGTRWNAEKINSSLFGVEIHDRSDQDERGLKINFNLPFDVKTKSSDDDLVAFRNDPFSCKTRPPRLGLLHGTAFSAMEDRQNEQSKFVDVESTSGQKSVDSGNFNSEVSQSADSNSSSPDGLNAFRSRPILPPGEERDIRNADSSRVTEDVGGTMHLGERSTPFPCTPVKLQQQGMTATGSDLFPSSHIKKMLQHSNSVGSSSAPQRTDDVKKLTVDENKTFKSVDVQMKAAVDETRDNDGTRLDSSDDRPSRLENDLPTYEEAIVLKAIKRHPHLLMNYDKRTSERSEKTIEESPRRTTTTCDRAAEISHSVVCKTVSLPSYRSATSTDDATKILKSGTTLVEPAEDSWEREEATRMRDFVERETTSSAKTTSRLCSTDGTDRQATFRVNVNCKFQSRDGGFGGRSKPQQRLLDVKTAASSSSTEDSDGSNSTDGSIQERVFRRRFRRRRNCNPRKRFSDPRMTETEMERPRSSALERSKSDSCELRWRAAARRRQVKERDERSKKKEKAKETGRKVGPQSSSSGHRPERRMSRSSDDLDRDRSKAASSSLSKDPDSCDHPSVVALKTTTSHDSLESDRADLRPSLTVKNRDWHKELMRQYTAAPVYFQPSPRSEVRSPPFGIETEPPDSEKDCTARVFSKSADDFRKAGVDLRAHDRLRKVKSCFETAKEPPRCDSAISTCNVLSKPSIENDSSTSIHLGRRQTKIDVKTKASDDQLSDSNLVRFDEGRQDSLPATDVDSFSNMPPPKVVASPADSEDTGVDQVRPSCYVRGIYVDDAVLLDPLNISWSVTRLREKYGGQTSSTSGTVGGKSSQAQSTTKTTTDVSRSRSEETSNDKNNV